KARRRWTPAPSRAGLDLLSCLTGRIDMLHLQSSPSDGEEVITITLTNVSYLHRLRLHIAALLPRMNFALSPNGCQHQDSLFLPVFYPKFFDKTQLESFSSRCQTSYNEIW